VVFGRRRIVAIQKLSGSKKEEVSNRNLASPGRFGGPFEFWRVSPSHGTFHFICRFGYTTG